MDKSLLSVQMDTQRKNEFEAIAKRRGLKTSAAVRSVLDLWMNLSDEALERVEHLSGPTGSRAKVIEKLIAFQDIKESYEHILPFPGSHDGLMVYQDYPEGYAKLKAAMAVEMDELAVETCAGRLLLRVDQGQDLTDREQKWLYDQRPYLLQMSELVAQRMELEDKMAALKAKHRKP